VQRDFLEFLKRPEPRYAALIALLRVHRTTLAPPPAMSFSTSLRVAIEVSPGVVLASAPCAAP
jgi:hypothetical protein